MKRRFNILFVSLLVSAFANAQSMQDIFGLIKSNNVSLRKYEAQCKAAKLDARTGITLADPEVEFGYLWGTPNEIGDRKDFSVTQSLDFATIFGLRRSEARSKEALADLELEQAQNLLFFTAQSTVIEITYMNRCIAELQQRLDDATKLEEYYRKLLANGEVNKIDMGRVSLAKVTAESDLKSKKIERETLVKRLSQMCSQSLSCEWTDYPARFISGDLSLALSKQESVVSSKVVQSARAEGLPELTAGYMSELTKAEKFRGVTVGISIPLWKNRNNVARAKAQQVLAEAETAELASQLESQRNELKSKADNLKELLAYLNSSISLLNSAPLMLKALNAGEMSLVDFINERAFYYELKDKILETEFELTSTIASLYYYEN